MSHTTTKILPQRVASTWVYYTRWERFLIWFREICRALKDYPSKETGYFRKDLIFPGEPGYDNPLNELVVSRTTYYPYPLEKK